MDRLYICEMGCVWIWSVPTFIFSGFQYLVGVNIWPKSTSVPLTSVNNCRCQDIVCINNWKAVTYLVILN